MNTQHQILFFLGIIGAFNALVMSIYFAYFVNHRNKANYYLSALLLVIGVKIITSVFHYFNVSLSLIIVEIGLSANVLIGPFFYLYVKASINTESKTHKYWWLHIVSAVLVIPVIGFLYPSTFIYTEGATKLSQYLVALIYFQWFIYLVLTAVVLKDNFEGLFKSKFKSNNEETWLMSLFFGISLFWIGPVVTSHTTYMVGALSFSIIFYGLLFLWVFKFRKTSNFFNPQVKYATKKIDITEVEMLSVKLNLLFKEKELFRNPNLKIVDVATEMQIHPQHLSQLLNDNLGKSFSAFTNEYRIEAAKEAILVYNKYTLETIGYECGFNSKSTFYTTFKRLTGLTPANFKAQAN